MADAAMTELFSGNREDWETFYDKLQFLLAGKGLLRVANNTDKRPTDIIWTAEEATDWSASQKEVANASRRKEQKEWDEKNDKAYAIIMLSLHADIRQGVNNNVLDMTCHDAVTYLLTEYGGPYDIEAVEHYLQKSNEKITATDTMEQYINRFILNSTKAGEDMRNEAILLATLKSNLKGNKRAEASLTKIRQDDMTWEQARKFLIKEDRAIGKSFTAVGVTFDEKSSVNAVSDITIQPRDQQQYYRKRESSPYPSNTRRDRSRKRSNSLSDTEDFKRRRYFEETNDSNKRRRSNSRDADNNSKYYNNQDNNHQTNNIGNICYQYRNHGFCNRQDCRFIHHESTVCRQYLRQGFCDRQHCQYRHNNNNKNISNGNDNNNNSSICRDWLNNRCNRKNCMFRHSNNTDQVRQISDFVDE